MKSKLIAFVLALTAASWAQTATQTTPAPGGDATAKAACACCKKMASSEAKDEKSCCGHESSVAKNAEQPMACSGKDKASCCKGDEAKSCKENCAQGKDKAAGCCKEAKCGKECKKGCGAPKTDKTAANGELTESLIASK